MSEMIQNLNYPVNKGWEQYADEIYAVGVDGKKQGINGLTVFTNTLTCSAYKKLEFEDQVYIDDMVKRLTKIKGIGENAALELISKLGMFIVSNEISDEALAMRISKR